MCSVVAVPYTDAETQARETEEQLRVSLKTIDELVALTRQLQTALTTRIVIEQAKGFIASAAGTDVDTAFHRIRRYARNHNLKVHDVCRAVLAGSAPELSRPSTAA